jgi:hypothetical protein
MPLSQHSDERTNDYENMMLSYRNLQATGLLQIDEILDTSPLKKIGALRAF